MILHLKRNVTMKKWNKVNCMEILTFILFTFEGISGMTIIMILNKNLDKHVEFNDFFSILFMLHVLSPKKVDGISTIVHFRNNHL